MSDSKSRRDTAPDTGSLVRPPARRSAVASFIVMDVMREAAELQAEGADVIHMEVGQPGTPAPSAARDAVRRALETDSLGYTLALGSAPLRERIARHYREHHGIDVAPERVVVTTGSSGAFVLAFLALFEAGERVLVPVPGYPCYRQILTALDCVPVLAATGPDTRWAPTRGQVEALHAETALAGVLVASPANPTGTIMPAGQMAGIADFCRGAGVWLISDEIYHGLTYGGPCTTALAHTSDAIVINSFSKYYSMTGWRVGWMIVPEALVRTIERLQQNLFISPPAVSQAAALGAFDAIPELEANRRVYAENRALLLKALPKAGLESLAPADGAFYLYADVSRFTDDSVEFVRAMLKEIKVAATPGVDFDPARGRSFVRFSYAGATRDMREAARRLQAWRRLAR